MAKKRRNKSLKVVPNYACPSLIVSKFLCVGNTVQKTKELVLACDMSHIGILNIALS